MLNETASTRSDHAPSRAPQAPLSREEVLHNEIRQMVASVLLIEKESFVEAENKSPDPTLLTGIGTQLVATFDGTLLMDSEIAYEKLDTQLAGVRHLALFRAAKPEPGEAANAAILHSIHIITGRVNTAPPRSWWPNLLLFIATFLSVLYVGTTLAISQIVETDPALADTLASRIILEMWRGLPYGLSILLILGAHELGHYFAARHHKLGVTLPYFIPLPIISPFGTMGAFIQLRQPMKNRKMLLDVGAAGPLVGMVFAVPILLIGLAQLHPAPTTPGGTYEGDSLLYAGAKILTYGHFVPKDGVDPDRAVGRWSCIVFADRRTRSPPILPAAGRDDCAGTTDRCMADLGSAALIFWAGLRHAVGYDNAAGQPSALDSSAGDGSVRVDLRACALTAGWRPEFSTCTSLTQQRLDSADACSGYDPVLGAAATPLTYGKIRGAAYF
jgi:hypothetical protein